MFDPKKEELYIKNKLRKVLNDVVEGILAERNKPIKLKPLKRSKYQGKKMTSEEIIAAAEKRSTK